MADNESKTQHKVDADAMDRLRDPEARGVIPQETEAEAEKES